MKKIRIFALICTLLLLSGCANPPTQTPTGSTTAPTQAPPATSAPSLETGSQEPRPAAQRVEKLDLEPLPTIAPEDRCAATSLGQMVETGNGYYMAVDQRLLYYADKSNLTEWVAVCNQPDCAHSTSPLSKPKCHAYLGGGIWGSDGKIYTVAPYEIEAITEVILASPGDGSGWTTAFSDENSPFNSTAGMAYGIECHRDSLCVDVCQMKANGFYDCFLYFVDKNGSHKYLYAEDFPDMSGSIGGNTSHQIHGDMVKQLVMEYPGKNVDPQGFSSLYRVSPEAIEKLELPEGCSCYGAYLSGNTMIHYHPNDGFYRLDYAGGVEEKIADAAYTDGFGYCLDGQFLVETTVNWQNTAKECKFRYFDGETWTEVPLPEEFTPKTNLRIVALTSDTLFLEEMSHAMYMVKLGDNQLVKCMDYPARY